ncbi:DNA-J related domain-containing protein [Shewanella sp. Isolate7]|uniref:DNA-J related domain-containing protein n=1 Tax=Shewanella sp. Isolate7 TaxID=2908528 RepID=UPI001EFD5836|nr:DNA-J related domain-containing protein [Shewanella sp. Isolate7]MCG9721098.1 DnaJ domain-containing protein [Shewanella sp. Isolate7]
MLLAKSSPTAARLEDASSSTQCFAIKGDNPLIWPLLTLLQRSNRSWKVHHLAAALQEKGLMRELDVDPQKALFKQNFLLMNALFELQAMLLPGSYLQVKAMEIQIFRIPPSNLDTQLSQDDALRSYYLDWQHYDTCPDIIQEMLESFWQRYEDYIGTRHNALPKRQALQVFELDQDATDREIRKQWRKLALQWHPDRDGGDAAQFKRVCEAWQTLRESR